MATDATFTSFYIWDVPLGEYISLYFLQSLTLQDGKKKRNTLMEMEVFNGKTSVYNKSTFTCIIDLNI